VKRSLLALTALALCISARADEDITKIQTRLRAEGFYRGNPTGNYDSETAAAVTRYQIRHGLAITGKLDPATSRELGIAASVSEARPKTLSGSWRRLRSGEMQFVEQPSATHSAKTKDDCGELLKCSFQILDNFRGDHAGRQEVGAVFEAFAFERCVRGAP
jgi:peptidoglycan hydrolase-like protein with peptidoglycan-binding domain